MSSTLYLIILGIGIALVVFGLIYFAGVIEDPVEEAGRRGEEVATDIISTLLKDSDYLLTNVNLSYEGKRTEIDNLIVNEKGVFIIEVKNYVGDLYGDVDDDQWKKYKTTPGGDVYVKPVRNPIKQVNRQVYILSKVLKSHNINVWVEGYVMLIEQNSPVDNPAILWDKRDISRAIHGGQNQLDRRTVNKIVKFLDR